MSSKPYHCPVCGKKFKNENAVRQHDAEKHGIGKGR